MLYNDRLPHIKTFIYCLPRGDYANVGAQGSGAQSHLNLEAEARRLHDDGPEPRCIVTTDAAYVAWKGRKHGKWFIQSGLGHLFAAQSMGCSRGQGMASVSGRPTKLNQDLDAVTLCACTAIR